jgi:hypothetical protein
MDPCRQSGGLRQLDTADLEHGAGGSQPKVALWTSSD